MTLTLAQLQAINADIAANGDLNVFPNNSDGNSAIAAIYNITASPNFVVWRTKVPMTEIMLNGFDWARVDNLSVGKARIWDWMLGTGSLDASKSNVRAGIDATWVGTAPDLAVRAAVYVHCKRVSSRIEKLLSTGTGSDASPATMGSEGPVSYQNIEAARNS